MALSRMAPWVHFVNDPNNKWVYPNSWLDFMENPISNWVGYSLAGSVFHQPEAGFRSVYHSLSMHKSIHGDMVQV